MIFFWKNSYNSVHNLFRLVVHITCEEPEVSYFLMYLFYSCLRVQFHDFVRKRFISGVNNSHFHFLAGNEHLYILSFVCSAKMRELPHLPHCTVCCKYVIDYVLDTFYKWVSTRLRLFWSWTLEIYQPFLSNNRNLAKVVSVVSRDFRTSRSDLCSLKIHWSFAKLPRKFPSRRFCSVYPL